MSTSENDLDPESADYARSVGERLRAIRRQKRLSLQEAEELSHQEFKASVLGAYERGERAISVPRLQRLARVYQVPVDQLLPRATDDSHDAAYLDLTQSPSPPPRKVVLDLARLDEISGTTGEMLQRYRARGRVRTRVIPDFMIGAHALLQCRGLITYDSGFHRDYFKGLKVIVPGEP